MKKITRLRKEEGRWYITNLLKKPIFITVRVGSKARQGNLRGSETLRIRNVTGDIRIFAEETLHPDYPYFPITGIDIEGGMINELFKGDG